MQSQCRIADTDGHFFANEQAFTGEEDSHAQASSGVRVVILDPDESTRETVRSTCREQRILNVVGEASDWNECLRMIDQFVPELLVVRFAMVPNDWYHRLSNDPTSPLVIALGGRESLSADSAVTYHLPLPLSPPKLRLCFNRVLSELLEKKMSGLVDLIGRYTTASNSSSKYLGMISVEHNRQLLNIDVANLASIVAARKHIRINTTDGEYQLRESLHSFVSRLDPERFIQVHRSIVINLACVEIVIRRKNLPVAIKLKGGAVVPVGPQFREKFAA